VELRVELPVELLATLEELVAGLLQAVQHLLV
jgi:hypothetical protein